MDLTEMGNLAIQSPAGLLGSIATFMAAAYAVYRRFSRSEKVSDATADSNVNQIDRLTKLLEASDARTVAAYARATLSDQRADAAYAERNELMSKMGAMTEQIARLSEEVKQVGPLRDEIHRLTSEITKLKAGMTQ